MTRKDNDKVTKAHSDIIRGLASTYHSSIHNVTKNSLVNKNNRISVIIEETFVELSHTPPSLSVQDSRLNTLEYS